MPRYRRAFLTEYPYHIIQRGHNRQPVFATAGDCRVYLDNLIEQKTRLGVRVYAYCLMTNHVHLVAQPHRDGADLSEFMRVLAARQTRYTNRLQRRSGTLWEGRFKASLIETDAYLLGCGRYVDLNPVRARMVSQAQEFEWSSYRARAGYTGAGPWLDWDPVYVSLGANLGERQMRYRQFVAAGVPASELRLIRQALRRNQVTGTERFIDAVACKLGRRVEARGPGRPRRRHGK